MFKTFLALLVLGGTAASALATTTIEGNFTWDVGTLTAPVTIAATAQTISLKIGSTTYSLPNTFLPGDVGTELAAGTTMEFLAKGSAPFIGTYAAGADIVVYDPDDGSTLAERRAVPIGTTGGLTENIAAQLFPYSIGWVFQVPPCTVGTISFPNGLDIDMGVPLANYTFTVPVGTATTFNTVTFPSGSLPMNQVNFLAYGNGQLSFLGRSSKNAVEVSGNLMGTGTILTQVNLSFAAQS